MGRDLSCAEPPLDSQRLGGISLPYAFTRNYLTFFPSIHFLKLRRSGGSTKKYPTYIIASSFEITLGFIRLQRSNYVFH